MTLSDASKTVPRLTPQDVARLRDDRRARWSLEIGAVIHIVQPHAADLLATLCFYAVFVATGSVGIATVLAAAFSVSALPSTSFVRPCFTSRLKTLTKDLTSKVV